MIRALALALLLASPALAHNDHEWVREGGFKSPTGIDCCDKNDCHVLPTDQLLPVEGGWAVYWKGKTEIVSEKETIKHSPDGKPHICLPEGGAIRCLFVPPMGS